MQQEVTNKIEISSFQNPHPALRATQLRQSWRPTAKGLYQRQNYCKCKSLFQSDEKQIEKGLDEINPAHGVFNTNELLSKKNRKIKPALIEVTDSPRICCLPPFFG